MSVCMWLCKTILYVVKSAKIYELPGGFALLDPLPGLCSGPTGTLDPSPIFAYTSKMVPLHPGNIPFQPFIQLDTTGPANIPF